MLRLKDLQKCYSKSTLENIFMDVMWGRISGARLNIKHILKKNGNSVSELKHMYKKNVITRLKSRAQSRRSYFQVAEV